MPHFFFISVRFVYFRFFGSFLVYYTEINTLINRKTKENLDYKKVQKRKLNNYRCQINHIRTGEGKRKNRNEIIEETKKYYTRRNYTEEITQEILPQFVQLKIRTKQYNRGKAPKKNTERRNVGSEQLQEIEVDE